MESFWQAAKGRTAKPNDYEGVEFWSNPGQTHKYIKTRCLRWYIKTRRGKTLLVQGFHHHVRVRARDVAPVATCLAVKGAEDVFNKQNVFVLSTQTETMYFIVDMEKEKEDWINSIGRSIVQHTRLVIDSKVVDYDIKK